MRSVFTRISSFIFLCIFCIVSCKKDGDDSPAKVDERPLAKAGPDISVSLSSCTDKNGIAELDGTASSDPESGITSYYWQSIGGSIPAVAVLKNPHSVKTTVENIHAGVYKFALTVRDAKGQFSTDTVMITATGPVKEYDLDLSTTTNFHFHDNYLDIYGYSDDTQIEGNGSFNPFGSFHVSVYETADTATSSDSHSTTINIINEDSWPPLSLYGISSINFKQLIQQGGGLINGTMTLNDGSATNCQPTAFDNLSPLTVTGNLDVNTGIVDLRIKGKVYF